MLSFRHRTPKIVSCAKRCQVITSSKYLSFIYSFFISILYLVVLNQILIFQTQTCITQTDLVRCSLLFHGYQPAGN